MKRIRLQLNKPITSPSEMPRKLKIGAISTAKRNEKVDGDLLFSRTATAPTTTTGARNKLRLSSSIHPNLRSMCIRNSSRSLSQTTSDSLSSPLSFIEEPLCTYLSLFDGTKKDMTDDHIHIIDNLFSENFVHMMDGNAPIDKLTFVQINKQMLKQGIVATLEDINFVDEYNLEYTVHWYYTEDSSRVTHVSALVADRKIVKLEPCVETRGAYANNMTFSSAWRDAKETDPIPISSSRRSSWLGLEDILPRRGNSDSTASTIDESSLHTAPTLLSNLDLDHDHEENENPADNLESDDTTTLQHDNEVKSTRASIDEDLLLLKLQEVAAAHNEDYARNEIGKPSCDAVNQNEDEERIKRGNDARSRSSKQVKVKRRWFRIGGRKKKNKKQDN